MNWLVFHIVSGQAFFSGVVLLVFAAFASTQSQFVFRRLTVITFLVGLIAVVISSTPVPYWLCVAAGLVTLAWTTSAIKKHWRRRTASAMAAIWLIAACLEIPYHRAPALNPARSRAITIIGDSVTAGVGGDETSETWPSILSREHQLEVQDISHMGETAASALIRAKSHEIDASLVIVEIGGNDVLGSTTSEQFAADLDALLAHLVAADRQLVMFELPLPPFYHAYGRIQRAVAARHNVILIPKRIFLSVIGGSDSTLDTIHLSQAGHKLMADSVWRLIRPAFSSVQIARN